MSWYKLSEKIKFFCQATNAHGLHSPFAYNFYTNLKAQVKKNSSVSKYLPGFSKKENRIISALFQLLKPKQVLLLSSDNETKSLWENMVEDKTQVFTARSLDELPENLKTCDLIIMSKLHIINDKDVLNKIKALISNHTVVIIPHIHASKTAIRKWESLLKKEQISVSMDLFFIGLLFFRKESTKQDFQLRF